MLLSDYLASKPSFKMSSVKAVKFVSLDELLRIASNDGGSCELFELIFGHLSNRSASGGHGVQELEK